VTDEVALGDDGHTHGVTLTLGFDPDVSEADALTIDAVLVPTPFSRTLPDAFLTEHGNGLAAGAVATLALMRKKPWFDPETAARKHADYMDAVSTAMGMVLTGRRGGKRTLGA
jgi:hypothetical protein